MTRRTNGPKRRAESYAGHTARALDAAGYTLTRDDLARAWMAGYQSAARARRISRPKPRS